MKLFRMNQLEKLIKLQHISVIILVILTMSSCFSAKIQNDGYSTEKDVGGYNIQYFNNKNSQEETIVLQGIVKMGSSNKPINKAEIEVRNTDNKTIAKETTDNQGKFNFAIKTEPTKGVMIINGSDWSGMGELEIGNLDLGDFYTHVKISAKLFYVNGLMINSVPLTKKEIKEIKKMNKKNK